MSPNSITLSHKRVLGVAIPIVLAFISGIIMEKITLDYENNIPKKEITEIQINEEE